MKRGQNRANGFTLIEIMITVAILGILAAVAIPHYYDKIRQAKAGVCDINRNSIEKAAMMYYQDTTLQDGTPIPSPLDLVQMKYFDTVPQCPSNGIYIWTTGFYQTGLVPRMGCSIHFIPPP